MPAQKAGRGDIEAVGTAESFAFDQDTVKNHRKGHGQHGEKNITVAAEQQAQDGAQQQSGENGDGQSQIGYTMETPPKNLRQIAKRRNGVFPDAEISKIIAGVENVPGHSTNVMPAWWDAFKKAEGITDEKVLQAKIDHITAYLKTIQE